MKRFLAILWAGILALGLSAPVSAEETGQKERLADEAGLLNTAEQAEIEEELGRISEKYQCDVVIVTTDTLMGKTPRAYADDYYDSNGYGYGPGKDGVLLLVSMEDRDWWISTCGYGIEAFTEWGIEYIGEQIVEDLGDGDYSNAFQEFAELSDQFLKEAKSGTPYDVGNKLHTFSDYLLAAGIALAAALVIAWIVLCSMKRKLKSVHTQREAGNYVREGSFSVTGGRELFLYRHTSRTLRQSSSSSGGSRTHTSSSGTTHGGGGGKF